MNALLRRIDAVNAAHPWSHNDHYLPWVLRQVPPGARRALDVGCGTGTLLTALAAVVPQAEGIDRDPRVADWPGPGSRAFSTCRPSPRTTWSPRWPSCTTCRCGRPWSGCDC